MDNGALSDLKVVEFGQLVSGPYCAKLMADLGAEVIKVEPPGQGDEARRVGPFPDDIPHPERSGLFLYLNTSKLGVTLNLATATGAHLLKELLKEADVFVENQPPQVMEKLGLDYESLQAINPRLVVTSITGFGQWGPYRDYKSTDLICNYLSGLARSTPGKVENAEEQPPLRPGGRQSDFVAGVTAAGATMCALWGRRITGMGQHVDVSQHEAMASFERMSVAYYSYDWEQRLRLGTTTRQAPGGGSRGGAGLIPCKDGYVAQQTTEEYQWQGFMRAIGSPEWAYEERFLEAASRQQNWEALQPLLWERTTQFTKEELFHRAQAERVPLFPCNDIDEVLVSEQLVSRGFFIDIDHPAAGQVCYPGAQCQFTATPWRIERPAPLLGQHNEEVLCGRLGYSRLDLVRLREAGII